MRAYFIRRSYAEIFTRHGNRGSLLFGNYFISCFSTCYAIFSFSLLSDLTGLGITTDNVNKLYQSFLGRAMALAVGIELIKMFSKPSPNTIIEVLVFALVRQLIVKRTSILDFLLGVLAVAILFAVRKYLFTQFDDSNNLVMRASQKVKLANVIARVHIEAEKSETLRDFVTRKLLEEDKTIRLVHVFISTMSLFILIICRVT